MDLTHLFWTDCILSLILNLSLGLHKNQRQDQDYYHHLCAVSYSNFFIFQKVILRTFEKQCYSFPVITHHSFLISVSSSYNDQEIILAIKEILCFNINFLEKPKFRIVSEYRVFAEVSFFGWALLNSLDTKNLGFTESGELVFCLC